MRKLFTIVLAAIPTLLLAHHSFEAEFDRTKQVTLTGTITKFEWMNPHIWIYMDVKTADGKVAKYQFEGGAPNMLKRNGWSRTSLKEGDTATIVGALSKDGTNTVNATSVTLADGTKVLAGSSDTKAKVK